MRINVNNGSFEEKQNILVNNGVPSAIKNALISASLLKEGQVFDGKIQDIIGNIVKLDVGEGKNLTAILEKNVDFNIGDNVSFQVKSNDGTKIILQSIQKDTPTQSNVLIDAMEQAGIEINERNVSMVRSMMSFGMSVNANSLIGMERIANNFQETEVSVLVEMKSHDIPISEENISQFQIYKSYEHKISDSINQLTDSIIKMAEDSINSENTAVSEKINNIIRQLTENVEVTVIDKQSNDINSEQVKFVEQVYEKSEEPVETGNILRQKSDIQLQNDINKNIDIDKNTILFTKASEANFSESAETTGILKNNDVLAELKKIFPVLREKWLVIPEKLQGKSGEEIKDEIYEKYRAMVKDTNKLMQAMENNGLGKSEPFKIAQNIKNNINFMHEINNMASYVQIPFKTFDGENSGELYVYNKRRKKALKDGPVTAFLHLYMEHLGATDVKITLDQSRVNTKFSVEDPQSQKIIEKNLPILKERLEKLGYTAQLNVDNVQTETEDTPFEKILNIDNPRKTIKRYSFDIRT